MIEMSREWAASGLIATVLAIGVAWVGSRGQAAETGKRFAAEAARPTGTDKQ